MITRYLLGELTEDEQMKLEERAFQTETTSSKSEPSKGSN